jgi:flagellar biosynthesis/type III secretory pathway chaperone
MSRQQLSLAAMQALCQFWLNEPAPRKILNAHPELKQLIPRIEHAQQTLFATDTTKDQRLQKLSQQAQELDGVHDDCIRLLLAIFDALTMLSPDNSTYTELRDWMFPQGLSHTQDSYATEVGHALRIEQELPQYKKQLAAIKMDGTSLLSVVDQYLTAAANLGAVEQQRATENQPTNIRAARNEWQQVVTLLVTTAKVLKLSAGDTQTLFGQLNAASTKKPAKTPPVNPTPTPPVPSPTPAPTTEPAPPSAHSSNGKGQVG